MTSRRHTPDPGLLARVLDRPVERVQVWAVDRDTGKPFYLDDGEADQQREFAKARLRCPYPGCDALISTKGKSKRDHFFHVNGTPHPPDGESEQHLAAKRMLADWLSRRAPSGCSVVEEESVKDPATAVNRRADVMVTSPRGEQRVAFEVEYKNFASDAWRQKNSDYTVHGIPCVWLIGHTRLKRYSTAAHADPEAVRVPFLAREWATTGFVLVIDPVDRLIGTLTADHDHNQRIRYPDWEAYAAFESLDDCWFHPEYGLVTPTMAHILKTEAAERVRLQGQRERATRQAEVEARQKEEAAGRWARIEARNKDNWETSTFKATVEARWGTRLPLFLTEQHHDMWGVHALPVHWHTVLYETLIHPHPNGDARFTITDVYQALDAARIDNSRSTTAKVFKAVIRWLEAVQRLGLVTIHKNNDRVHHVAVNCNWDNHEEHRRNVEREKQARRQAAAEQDRRAKAEREAAEAARYAAVAEERAQRDAADELAAWWESSDLRQEVVTLLGGMVPAYLTWGGDPTLRHLIVAHPAHWHALVYLNLIRSQPHGTTVTVAYTAAFLRRSGITLRDGSDETIDDYLHNLSQRGILAGPAPDTRPAEPDVALGRPGQHAPTVITHAQVGLS